MILNKKVMRNSGEGVNQKHPISFQEKGCSEIIFFDTEKEKQPLSIFVKNKKDPRVIRDDLY